MDSFVNAFHIDWHIILAQAINFALVVFVLYRFAIKPLKAHLDVRKGTIEKGLTDAKTNAEMLESTKREYEKVLAEARKEAEKIMKGVKYDADTKRKELMAAAEEDVRLFATNARKDLESEKSKMLSDAKKELGEMVISATSKVLGNAVSKPVDAKLVEEAVKQL